MLGGQETAPFAITGHTSGVVNGSDVVVFGGHHANNTRNRAYVLKYPKTRSWEEPEVSGQQPSARAGHSSVLFGQSDLVIFGGRYASFSYNDTFLFDTKSWRWEKLRCFGQLPLPRSHHSAVATGHNSMLIFGGKYLLVRPLNDLLLFTRGSARSEWKVIAGTGEVPSPRYGHSAIVWKNEMIIFGGCDGKTPLNDVHVFNIGTNAWRSEKLSGYIEPRFGAAAALVDNKMFVVGGESASGPLSDVYYLDLDKKTWVYCGELSKQPLVGHSLAVIDKVILCVGGVDVKTVHAIQADKCIAHKEKEQQKTSGNLKALWSLRYPSLLDDVAMENSRDRATQDLVDVVKAMKSVDKEVETLQSQVREKEKVLQEHKKESAQLSRQQQGGEGEDASSAEVGQLQQQALEAKKRLREKKGEKKAAKEALRVSQQQLEEKTKVLDGVSGQLENEKSVAQKLRKEIQELEEKTQASTHEAARLGEEKNSLASGGGAASNIPSANEDVQRLNEEIEEVRSDINTKAEDITKSTETIANLQQEKASLGSKPSSTESEQPQDQSKELEELSAKNEEHKKNIKELESIKQEAEIAKAELEKQFEEQKQFLEKAVQEAEEWKRLLQEEERLRKQAETNLGSASGGSSSSAGDEEEKIKQLQDDADLLKKKVESMTSENKRVERQLRMEALTTGSMSEISRKGTEIKRLTHEVQQLQEKLEEEASLGEKEAKAVTLLEERVANAGQRPATNEGWEELLKKYEEQVKERDEKLDKLEAEEEDWMQSTNELQNLSDLAVKEVQAEIELLRKKLEDLKIAFASETGILAQAQIKLDANKSLIAKAQEAN